MLLNHKLYDSNKVNNTILTFGNFDGLHLGHFKLIEKMINLSLQYKSKSILLTFSPHTSQILNPEGNYKILTSYNQKKQILSNTKLNFICEVNFNLQFSNMLPEQFIDLLIDKYSPKYIVLGYDNKFGKNGTGSIDTLMNKAKYKMIKFIKINPYKFNDKIIKSSLIRDYIVDGNIILANKYLNRPYQLIGEVVKGESIGKKIGFPTANIKILNKEQLIPKNGVYSVTLIVANNKKNAICNIGYRPTIKFSNKITIEVHVINEDLKLYGKIVKINFNHFIRDEIKFENKNQLA